MVVDLVGLLCCCCWVRLVFRYLLFVLWFGLCLAGLDAGFVVWLVFGWFGVDVGLWLDLLLFDLLYGCVWLCWELVTLYFCCGQFV